jgi:N-hydroxyarylamine O-acetyltransferase
MNVDAYLARIGYDGPREPTVATLFALHERHLRSVPFENLDIHFGREIVVDEERFVAKIVDERRGGFCYELNGAFAALLRALGFEVELLSGRVRGGDGRLGPPFDHMTLRVDGRWLADVGFGDSFLLPLDLDDRGVQQQKYRIEEGEEWRVLALHDGQWTDEYVFTPDPHPLEDFAPMCAWQQSSPESSFTKKRVCTIVTDRGRVTLTTDRLIVTEDGVKSETPVAAEDWPRVLFERFGIRAIAR